MSGVVVTHLILKNNPLCRYNDTISVSQKSAETLSNFPEVIELVRGKARI